MIEPSEEMNKRTRSMKPNEEAELHNPKTVAMMSEIVRIYDEADSEGKPITMRFGGLLADGSEAHFKVTVERVEV